MGKDQVGGVQPIEYMLTLPIKPAKPDAPATTNAKENAARAPQPKIRWSMENYLPHRLEKNQHDPAPMAANSDIRLRPLATPLMMSGVPQKAFEQFEPIFKSYG